MKRKSQTKYQDEDMRLGRDHVKCLRTTNRPREGNKNQKLDKKVYMQRIIK